MPSLLLGLIITSLIGTAEFIPHGHALVPPVRMAGAPPCGLNRDNFPKAHANERISFDNTAWFCYNGTKVDALVLIPHTSWKISSGRWPYTPAEWSGYIWYLQDGMEYLAGKHWWGHVVIASDTSPSWTYPNIGWRSPAIFEVFSNLTYTGQYLSLRLNTTSRALEPNFGSNCHLVTLMAWSRDTDPGWRVGFCSVPQTQTAISTNSTAISSLKPSKTSTIATSSIIINRKDLTSDDWFLITTGISGQTNNWLLMAEQAANATKTDCVVCMGSRPLLQIVPAPVPPECVIPLMNSTNPTGNCTYWDSVFPLTPAQKNKPLFSTKVAPANFTCINFTTTGKQKEKTEIRTPGCTTITRYTSQPTYIISRADVWWWCGGPRLYDRLPINMTAVCALVTLLLPVQIYPLTVQDLPLEPDLLPFKTRQKRAVIPGPDPTYIDAIGIPRGVPDEYKLVDQVASGWESTICWWCTINKNVDRINYIHYNVQRLSNWTQAGFEAVHEQLAATSLMAFQNRIAIDMLLAEKGGVCALFGTQCCTFIPNNTAADGSLTKAVEGLRSLSNKMKEHSGVDTSMWDSWLNMFGAYKTLISSVLVSLTVFAAILTTCGCCLIPCLRSLIQRLIVKTIEDPTSPALIHLLQVDNDDSENECNEDEYVA